MQKRPVRLQDIIIHVYLPNRIQLTYIIHMITKIFYHEPSGIIFFYSSALKWHMDKSQLLIPAAFVRLETIQGQQLCLLNHLFD